MFFGNDISLDGNFKVNVHPDFEKDGSIYNVDLNQNELRNIKLHNLTSAPEHPVLGQIYYDIGKNRIGVCVKEEPPTWYYGNVDDLVNLFADTNTVEFSKNNNKVTAVVRIKDDLTSDSSGIELDKTGVTAGTYPKVTVDVKGRVTSGASLLSSDLPSHTHVANDVTDFIATVKTVALNDMTAPTGNVSLNSKKITSLAAPTNNTDAANKEYVDNVAALGLKVHTPVKAATTTNITLKDEQTIDGIELKEDDTVLVKNQAASSANGIYTVKKGAAVSWVRVSDADEWQELAGLYVFVDQGDTQANSGWYCTAALTGTVGTDPLPFVLFSRAGDFEAGDALDKDGNTFNVKVDDVSIEINSDALRVKVNPNNVLERQAGGLGLNYNSGTFTKNESDELEIAGAYQMQSKRFTITGDGTSKTFYCTHNFNTKDIHTSIVKSDGTVIFTDVKHTNVQTTIKFKSAVPFSVQPNYVVTLSAAVKMAAAIAATGS